MESCTDDMCDNNKSVDDPRVSSEQNSEPTIVSDSPLNGSDLVVDEKCLVVNESEMPVDASCHSSKSSSPDPDLGDIKPVGMDSSSYNIMSVCSTAAQHIRQTITEVLNSRLDGASSSVIIEEVPDSLEESLKQKLEDFENTVKNNMSQPSNPDTAIPELAQISVSDKEVNISDVQDSNLISTQCADVSVEPKDSGQSVAEEIDPSNSQKLVKENESEKSEPKVGDQNCSTNEVSTKDCSIPSEKKGSLGASNSKAVSCNGAVDHNSVDSKLPSAESPVSITEERSSKKSSRNSSNKKKGERSVDHILKSLAGLPSTEEKLQTLCRKHSEVLDDLKCADLRMKQSEKQILQFAKEKEQLQAEHNRMILAKSKLESLCRELQRQNKAVKEESLLRIREEEEKRKEVASKFQTTLNEISNLMQENSKKNLQLKEENTELAQKLKTLVEHYEMWEKHMEKVVQQKDLEAQLAKAKHAKTNLQLKQETEKFLKEKQGLLENMSELQKKCTQLATNELQLRAELNDYTSKYEEFQSVLNKSNQVFASFKTDMETTSKKIKKLEKETNIWKQKWESSNNALLEMITDKQKRDKELINAQQRILTLEKLCRALQAERNDLQSKLNGQNVDANQSVATEMKEAC